MGSRAGRREGIEKSSTASVSLAQVAERDSLGGLFVVVTSETGLDDSPGLAVQTELDWMLNHSRTLIKVSLEISIECWRLTLPKMLSLVPQSI